MTHNTTHITCPHCGGDGTVWMVTPFDPDDVSHDTCPVCDGKKTIHAHTHAP
jgi:DnaJ-class molecular chaperone